MSTDFEYLELESQIEDLKGAAATLNTISLIDEGEQIDPRAIYWVGAGLEKIAAQMHKLIDAYLEDRRATKAV